MTLKHKVRRVFDKLSVNEQQLGHAAGMRGVRPRLQVTDVLILRRVHTDLFVNGVTSKNELQHSQLRALHPSAQAPWSGSRDATGWNFEGDTPIKCTSCTRVSTLPD